MIDLKINKSEALPINIQLTEQLRYHIQSGRWGPGRKLPTVRELAAALRLNYNTIRAAYQELEREGYVTNEQGRGTFVTENPPRLQEDRHESLVELVDEALAKVRAMGVSTEEFARLAYTRAKLFTPEKAEVLMLFTECNRADTDFFARSIEESTGVRPLSFLLRELRGRGAEFFAEFDLLVTTLSHAAEFQEIVGAGRAVIGLMYVPSYLEVVNEIMHLPKGTRVGLVCADREAARNRARSLVERGVKHLRFLTAGIDKRREVERVFEEADQIYVSRMIVDRLGKRLRGDGRVREYTTELDAVALRMLRRQIAKARAARAEDEG
jgi:DNA-binding transcriptional regulator YhcF (GntR family)